MTTQTVRRTKRQARLVITLEVECDMRGAPTWQDDALCMLRQLHLEPRLSRKFMSELKQAGVTVISQSMDVAK